MERTDTLNTVESTVIKLLLAGDAPVLDQLRRQFKHLRVTSRDFTDIGFETALMLSDRSDELEQKERFQISDVYASFAGVSPDPGFALWIESGRLSKLECFTYDPSVDPHGQARGTF